MKLRLLSDSWMYDAKIAGTIELIFGTILPLGRDYIILKNKANFRHNLTQNSELCWFSFGFLT